MQSSTNPPAQPSYRALHLYACIVAACTFILVCAGGLVTSKGAGLSVPDWPTSYGGINPPRWWAIETVRAEHGHRLIAGFVSILTMVLAGWIWLREPRQWVRRYALLAPLAILLQALLGGLTVKFMLPTPISVGHATLGQIFFCITVTLALFTAPHWRNAIPLSADENAYPIKPLCFALAAIVFIQLILGALMRHTGSGLAIPDFPLAYNRVFPPLDAITIYNVNIDRDAQGLNGITAGNILIHYAHRVWAMVVCVAAITVIYRALKHYGSRIEILMPALFLGFLLTIQIMLGAMTIWTMKQPHVATAHVGVGAMILAASVILSAEAVRLGRRAPSEQTVPIALNQPRPIGETEAIT